MGCKGSGIPAIILAVLGIVFLVTLLVRSMGGGMMNPGTMGGMGGMMGRMGGTSVPSGTGDPAAGATLAAACANCHGAEGVSRNPSVPNLAGQQESYLIMQLRAFRDGSRSDPVMTPMVARLSDDHIEALAAYYSNLRLR